MHLSDAIKQGNNYMDITDLSGVTSPKVSLVTLAE